jgi:hypothetical protein
MFIPQAPHILAKEEKEKKSQQGKERATQEKEDGGVESWASALGRGVAAVVENCGRIYALAREASPAVQLLLGLRFSLSLGFHMFNVRFCQSFVCLPRGSGASTNDRLARDSSLCTLDTMQAADRH